MHKNILIVVGIIILFLGTCINPSVAIDNIKESSIPISNGNTLYVGGTGEGNYSSIQDAIDNATDGDTVFVYDDSSPYHELITINISINLIGENKETTIITAEGNFSIIVKINADDCLIKDLTFRNTSSGAIVVNSVSGFKFINNILYSCGGGIGLIDCSYCVISENQFNYCTEESVSVYMNNSYNSITHNTFNLCVVIGVSLWDNNSHNTISHNTFYKCGLFGSIYSDYNCPFNNISYNMFNNCTFGMLLVEVHNWIISHNIFKNNIIGILLSGCTENVISFNNFQFNLIRNAMVMYRESENKWSRNYWNRPRLLPKVIHGIEFLGEGHDAMPIPMFNLKNVDWHPSILPNKIEI